MRAGLTGTTLGHYEILDLLGAGGMGEVYRATDTKLGREVALKALPEAFTADRERLARFEREARALAAMNHPGIAAIYSFEAAEAEPPGEAVPRTVHFLVMQLAEGETLAERLGRGPLPVEEALALGLQIATALESAHEKGIIHRDLKPGNVKVDADDQVKILDFGLAKALETPGAFDLEEGQTLTLGSAAPTLPAEMTQEGMVLGTVGYMSPEQARGQPADKRADIWAFGCVLFEMLTGERAFGGETASDRFARILERDPDWQALPEGTPTSVRILLRRCLAKDPKRRLHDMADVRLELEEVSELEGLLGSTTEPAPLWRRALPWVLAAVGVAWGSWAVFGPREAARPSPVTRFSIPEAQLALLGVPTSSQVEISRDGSMLAYMVEEGRANELRLRRFDSMEETTLITGEMVSAPFFSPDGSWVGFQENREIKRISIEGGKSWVIAETGFPLGATWGEDGTVVYADELNFGLWRVPWDGGEPERLTRVDRDAGEYAHVAPQLLPGGREVLFTVIDDAANATKVAVVDVESGAREVLFAHDASFVRYLGSGHLAYGNDGSLMVVPFDLEKRALAGRPVAVFDGLLMGFLTGKYLASFAVADNGTLAYVSGPVLATGTRLLRVDRAGNATPLGEITKRVVGPKFSPDGERLAFMAQVGSELPQVWVRDLARGTATRLTLDGENWWPVWTPDGDRIVFPSRQETGEVVNLAWKRADGTGPIELLTQTDLSEQPTTWTPDGKTLIYHRNDHPETAWDIMALEPGSGQEPRVLVGSRFYEFLADLSPDGRWLAYVSDETGQVEVYVRSYPDLDRKWQISNRGGIEPAWSTDASELFYRLPDGKTVMAVPIATEPEFVPGLPELLFEGNYVHSGWFGRNYDVANDGQSFVMIEQVLPENIEAKLMVVLNWFTELERLAPAEP